MTESAANNAVNGSKAYVAAFSVNGNSPQKIISNALSSGFIDPLLGFPEVYIIGVEVDA